MKLLHTLSMVLTLSTFSNNLLANQPTFTCEAYDLNSHLAGFCLEIQFHGTAEQCKQAQNAGLCEYRDLSFLIPTDTPACNAVPKDQRVEGGWSKISKQTCESRGMCWDARDPRAKWCFVPEGKCNIKPQDRIEAGYKDISKKECLSRGACWNDSEKRAKWCFLPK